MELTLYLPKSVSAAASLCRHLEPVLYQHCCRKIDDAKQRSQEKCGILGDCGVHVSTCVHSPNGTSVLLMQCVVST
jgi:hypothetical protein